MKAKKLEDLLKSVLQEFIGDCSILIVEDDQDTINSMNNCLNQSNIDTNRIHLAKTADEAYIKIKSEPLALIIIDIKMNNFNGFEFIQKMKLNKKLRDIPTIIIGNYIDKDTIQKAFKLHIDNILVKPLNPLLFMEKVGHSIGA